MCDVQYLATAGIGMLYTGPLAQPTPSTAALLPGSTTHHGGPYHDTYPLLPTEDPASQQPGLGDLSDKIASIGLSIIFYMGSHMYRMDPIYR